MKLDKNIIKRINEVGSMHHSARKVRLGDLLKDLYNLIINTEAPVAIIDDTPKPYCKQYPYVSTEGEEVESPLFAEVAATGDVRIYTDSDSARIPIGVLVDKDHLDTGGLVIVTDNGKCKEGGWGKPIEGGFLKNTSANAKLRFKVLRRVSENTIQIKM